MFEIRRILRPAALLMAVVLLSLPAADASAGCLSEYNACEDCARSALWTALKKLSPSGIRDADIQRLDCGIDMWHCLLFAAHHEYRCAV